MVRPRKSMPRVIVRGKLVARIFTCGANFDINPRPIWVRISTARIGAASFMARINSKPDIRSIFENRVESRANEPIGTALKLSTRIFRII